MKIHKIQKANNQELIILVFNHMKNIYFPDKILEAIIFDLFAGKSPFSTYFLNKFYILKFN